jgi:hypothetical protein
MTQKIIIFIYVMVISLHAYAATDDHSETEQQLASEQQLAEIFITYANGAITYQDSDGQQKPLQSFAKIFSNTAIILPENSSLQIVYLESGKQESWQGPARFITGIGSSRDSESSTAPEIKDLPPFMLSVLQKSPDVISDIKTRQGMIRVRSLAKARKIKFAEQQYQRMLAETVANDITPEIYLITTLDELRVYNRMVKPLETMINKQPDNQQARELYDHFMLILHNDLEN